MSESLWFQKVTRCRMAGVGVLVFTLTWGVLSPISAQALSPDEESGHEQGQEEAHGEEQQEGFVPAQVVQQAGADIVLTPVTYRRISEEIRVPGEVRLDQYRAAVVAPRIAGQVVARHVRLGDRVSAGQPLVTLSSTEMAAAQGELITASREWRRVQALGREVVSERRYIAAQVAADLARARLLAFGMTPKQADELVSRDDPALATGEFDLLAPRDGTVIGDDFILGEYVEPGRVLIRLADEQRVWVRAQLRPEQAAFLKAGASVRILLADGEAQQGQVQQIYHTLDEETRTLPVRILVTNAGDRLHPGEYVEVAIPLQTSREVLAVPASALTLLQGEPVVFLAEEGGYRAVAVATEDVGSQWVAITDGLVAGQQVVSRGAFFLKSIMLKSQLGEGHAH